MPYKLTEGTVIFSTLRLKCHVRHLLKTTSLNAFHWRKIVYFDQDFSDDFILFIIRKSSLIQEMAWCLFVAKPLHQSMITHSFSRQQWVKLISNKFPRAGSVNVCDWCRKFIYRPTVNIMLYIRLLTRYAFNIVDVSSATELHSKPGSLRYYQNKLSWLNRFCRNIRFTVSNHG